MVTLNFARGVIGKLLELTERLRGAIVAAAEHTFPPAGVLIPIKIVADRRDRAYRRD
jgi:hypothetical protein